jgi:hypothetical protein
MDRLPPNTPRRFEVKPIVWGKCESISLGFETATGSLFIISFSAIFVSDHRVDHSGTVALRPKTTNRDQIYRRQCKSSLLRRSKCPEI